MACQCIGFPPRVRTILFYFIIIYQFIYFDSHGTFASAGGDGTVSIWDHSAKKRLKQYPKYSLGVQDIVFSHDGSRLAIAVSYGWENGAEQAAKSVGTAQVFIREMGDEVKVWTMFSCNLLLKVMIDLIFIRVSKNPNLEI